MFLKSSNVPGGKTLGKANSRPERITPSKCRVPCEEEEEEECGGVLGSVGECGGVCWSDEMKCDGWSH